MARTPKAAAAGWLACVGGLIALLLVAYGVGPAERLDAVLVSRLSAADGSAASSLATAVAHLGDPQALLLMLGGICGYALFAGRQRQAIAAVAIVAGANLTTQVLKVALAHPRYQPMFGWDQLGSTAFPSGHVTAAASIAVALVFVAPRRHLRRVVAVGVAYVIAVGAAVLVLAWHFPSDILGGILVALGWGFAVQAVLLLTGSRSRSRRIAQWPSGLPSP